MLRAFFIRIIDSPYAVRLATALTLALGFFFIFVWAPHPWSWQGIDSYHELAKALARGETFPTTDVPWGYAYYVAIFYRLFGDRIWIPLVVQATANASVPWLLFTLVSPLAGQRVATISALIVGLFSFNTIYASTQSSDAICTVLFLAGLLCFAGGVRRDRAAAFALSGVLFGLVPQFRPNMVLFPACLVLGLIAMGPRTTRTIRHLAIFVSLVIALQLPWIVRTYRLTGLLLPTSTHGGVQLWYGTLQTGPFLESRAHNPRFYFGSPAFPYTSLWRRDINIRAGYGSCVPDPTVPPQLVYWTDRDPQHRRVPPAAGWSQRAGVSFTVPAQANHTAIYYYFEQTGSAASPAQATFTTPLEGAANPFIAFVSDDHLGDLDRHDDGLDLFDLIRMLRYVAWQEPLRATDKLDLNHDGRIDQADINAVVLALVPDLAADQPRAATVESTADKATLRLSDGSWINVPRRFGGRQTDVELSLDGQMAPALVSRFRTFTSLTHTPRRLVAGECRPVDEIAFNGPFYLSEPHMMRRYTALALDNIRREPWAFVRASLYRAVRLFVVRGTGDMSTAQQFRGSSPIYQVGMILSVGYLAIFLVGVVIAYRRRSPLLLFLVPILYVPATICLVLTNMRYTVTVQPLMFAFVAMAIATALGTDDSRRPDELR